MKHDREEGDNTFQVWPSPNCIFGSTALALLGTSLPFPQPLEGGISPSIWLLFCVGIWKHTPLVQGMSLTLDVPADTTQKPGERPLGLSSSTRMERAIQFVETGQTDERYDPFLWGGNGNYIRVEEAPTNFSGQIKRMRALSEEAKAAEVHYFRLTMTQGFL